MLMGSYVGLALASFLQLRNASVRNAMMFASYICAFLFLVLLLALLVLLLKITERRYLMGKEAERQKGSKAEKARDISE